MEYALTHEQQTVFDAVERTNQNVLIQGKPGVGKSVLIRALTELGNKTYTLAAPTGLAALNIGGRTLHSIFRLPISGGILEHDFNNFPIDDAVCNNIKYNIKHLIIDEVSMVRADVFDYMDRMLRHVKGYDKPFGGVQLIVVGDFYQLPPVVIGPEITQLKNAGFESPFIFSARAFQDFNVFELQTVHRQKGDPKFLDLLDSARVGDVSGTECRALNKLVGMPDDLRIRLCGTNKQSEEVNRGMLANISEKPITYISEKFGEWPALPAEETLVLKVGAQVMVKMNGADRPNNHRGEFNSQVVNGTLGKVIWLSTALNSDAQSIGIAKEDGTEVAIHRKRWERKIKERVGDKWEERVVASFEQFPVALAWAISIHKSQGQSFDKVHVDASKIFAPGQLYVALSRCRSMVGLSLSSPVTPRKFFANEAVTNFFKYHYGKTKKQIQ